MDYFSELYISYNQLRKNTLRSIKRELAQKEGGHSFLQIILILCAWVSYIQAAPPQPKVAVVNSNCDSGPKTLNGSLDTVDIHLDSGFISLFNGKNMTGWWENCAAHSSDKIKGGIWLADSVQGILFARQENGNGGVLTTNQSYDHYEFIMDVFLTYGNDAGIFNRVTNSGKTWQTGLDYRNGSSVGGSYSENNWSPSIINDDPILYTHDTDPFKISLQNSSTANWTELTKKNQPLELGCSALGCVAADYPKIWNSDDWNQIRVKFYGGLIAGEAVTMETFIRKDSTKKWVPVYNRTVNIPTPKLPLGLQTHLGTQFWLQNTFNAYKNLKIRPLNSKGEVLWKDPSVALPKVPSWRQISLLGQSLSLPHFFHMQSMQIFIYDVQGQLHGEGQYIGEQVSPQIKWKNEPHLNPGLFLIEIRSKNQRITSIHALMKK